MIYVVEVNNQFLDRKVEELVPGMKFRALLACAGMAYHTNGKGLYRILTTPAESLAGQLAWVEYAIEEAGFHPYAKGEGRGIINITRAEVESKEFAPKEKSYDTKSYDFWKTHAC